MQEDGSETGSTLNVCPKVQSSGLPTGELSRCRNIGWSMVKPHCR